MTSNFACQNRGKKTPGGTFTKVTFFFFTPPKSLEIRSFELEHNRKNVDIFMPYDRDVTNTWSVFNYCSEPTSLPSASPRSNLYENRRLISFSFMGNGCLASFSQPFRVCDFWVCVCPLSSRVHWTVPYFLVF